MKAMRPTRTILIVVCSVVLCGRVFAIALPSETPQNLIKEVIYNELQDREKDSFWEYRIDRKTSREDVVEMQVETRYGPIHRVVSSAGMPLDDVHQRIENARLDQLLHSSSEQARVAQQYEQDEHRLQRLMALMPDAFVYEYDGMEDGGNVVRLNFRPNANFNPPTYEARVFHAMGGTLWVNLLQKRMAHLKGQILAQVDFGFGLLGHIEKGGTFEIQREAVSQAHWKTDLVDVHVAGRLILFKSVTKDQHEMRSGFKAVPTDITLEQAKGLLDQVTQADGNKGQKAKL
jgi:hypothetical protein